MPVGVIEKVSMSFSDLDDIAERFLACHLSPKEWTHQAHLTVGLWHVHRHGPEDALTRLRVGIRRLNESHGTPNSDTRGYHETITRAYVQLLSEFLSACPVEIPLTGLVARLLAGPVADKDVLLRFYSRDRLMSAGARAEWMEPDIAVLRVADILGHEVEG